MSGDEAKLDSILIVEPNKKAARQLRRILLNVVDGVEHVDSWSEANPASGEHRLLVVNYDALTGDERGDLVARFGGLAKPPPLLLVSHGECEDDFRSLFEARAITNLIAVNEEQIDPDALMVTARKLLAKDIFGLDKYFGWGVEPKRIAIKDSAGKREALQVAQAYAERLGVNSRLITKFCAVVDELVTNAVYNAPVDSDGNHRYASRARTDDVQLEPHEYAELCLASDGQHLAVSTSDPFGSLAADKVYEYLAKCLSMGDDQVDSKEGGAGIGLYYTLNSLTQFIVNIEPGHRTEFVGLMDIRGSYRDFASRPKSFHIFVADSEGRRERP